MCESQKLVLQQMNPSPEMTARTRLCFDQPILKATTRAETDRQQEVAATFCV